MFSTVVSLKYALLASQWSYRHFHEQRIDCYLNCRINLRPYSYTHYAMLYPQNGDRIVDIDSVTSLHPMYRNFSWFSCWEIHGNTMEPMRNSQESHGFSWKVTNCVEFLSINILNVCNVHGFPYVFVTEILHTINYTIKMNIKNT